MTMTPDEWLADFESKVVEMQRKAATFRRDLEHAGETISSADGKVTVKVAANGALLGLKLDGNAELAEEIMSVVRKAREGAAEHVVDTFRPLAGAHVDELDDDVAATEATEDTAEKDDNEADEGSAHATVYDDDDEEYGRRSIFEH